MEKIAFLFTGQGAQYVGMGKTFYDEYTIAKQTFEEANDILGFDLAKICFEGPLGELAKTENTQPALLTASIAAYRVYMQEIGLTPQFSAGHSLGEYSALVSAGAMKFSDAIKIVRQRGLFTKEIVDTGEGGMTIIDGMEKDIIENECRKLSDKNKKVIINCYNSPTQFAIAGHQDLVEQVETAMLDNDAQITPLIGGAPFHTPLMKPAADKLNLELRQYRFYQFKWPIISNVTGKPYREPEKIVDTLTLQFANPVQWQSTMDYLKKRGITVAVEMGPQNVLTKLVRANTPEIQAFCFGMKEDRNEIMELLSNDMNNRKDKPTVVTRSMAAAVATPNVNFDKEEYQKGVIEEYKKLQQLQEQLETDGKAPTAEQMKEAFGTLKVIFDTKRVPREEQEDWFQQIIDETGTFYTLKDFSVFE